MTKEGIIKAYDALHASPIAGGVQRDIGFEIAIAFAVEMVRRHNEECAVIADLWSRDENCPAVIREAKP